MTVRSPSSRRLLLAILAVALPSLALIGLGARLLVQESRLAQTEWTALLDEAYIDFAEALDSVALDAARTTFAGRPDSSVVFVSATDGNRLKTGQPKQSPSNAAFTRAMDRAQRAEFTSRNRTAALAAYREALNAATMDTDRAFAQLALYRLYRTAGRADESGEQLQSVLEYEPAAVDEFGVPVALFAAQTMAIDPATTLQALETHIARPIEVSTQAAYKYRAVRDSLRSRVAPQELEPFSMFVDDALMTARLRDDAPSFLPLLSTGQWMPYGGEHWVIGLLNAPDSSRHLVAFDMREMGERASEAANLAERGFSTAQLSSDGTLPNRYLGNRFNGIFGHITPTNDLPVSGWSTQQFLFILLAGLMIVGLASLGVSLLLRDTKRELETARMRSEFVSSVSHELKTPLTAIRMYAETLKIRRQDENTRSHYIDTIINESSRLTRLLNNVLDFARIEKGTRSYNPETVSLEQSIQTTLDTMTHVLEENQVNFSTNLPNGPTQVMVDADALEQVLLNLIGNAVKFTTEDKQIAISAQPNGRMATITVSDNGVGIASEELPFLFDPYFRSASERTAHIPGTGLGLSIVRHTIEAHGGQVWAKSEPGHGTTISFTVPLA